LHWSHHLIASTSRTKFVDASAPRQGDEPRRGCPPVGAVRLRLPPDLYEDVLDDLPRLAPLAEDSQCERVDERGVEVVEACEGVAVAACDLPEQPDRDVRHGPVHAPFITKPPGPRKVRWPPNPPRPALS